jgi:TPP-dependent trihydroxycyclohexane-1,2-dione (THcHDO) dehydratase
MNEIEQQIKVLNTKFFPLIQRILNRYSYVFTRFSEATKLQDQTEGFDAIFSFPDVKIPVRIRKFKYQKYMDFTVRSQTVMRAKTEIHKLQEGFGDYYFYAWADETDTKIEKYIIIDLNVFRKSIIKTPDEIRDNSDDTQFYTYSFDRLMKENAIIVYEKVK